jgi:AraC-like DNA-binding protein
MFKTIYSMYHRAMIWAELDLRQTRRIVDANFVRRTPEAFPPRSIFRPKAHFLYCQGSGRRRMADGQDEFLMQPGDVLLFMAGRGYVSYRPETPYRAMNILFAPEPTDQLLPAPPDTGNPPFSVTLRTRLACRRDPLISGLFEETVLLARSSSPLRTLKAALLLGQLLVELGQRSVNMEGSRSAATDYALALIERRLNHKIPLDELAAQVGLSRRGLTRRFRQETGRSIVDFQMEARIRMALSLLDMHPTIRLRELADTLGFCDEFHFSRTFKKRVGLSPAAYRRRGERDDATGVSR